MRGFRFLRIFTKQKPSWRLLHTSCVSCARFDAKEAFTFTRHIDVYFKSLDDEFLEHTRLQNADDIIRTQPIDAHLKQSFWSKFISVSQLCGNDEIVQSLILFILQDSTSHSISTLITVLKVLAQNQKFDEFESLYRVVYSRLEPSDFAACSTDLAQALCLTPLYLEALPLLDILAQRKLPVGHFAQLLTASATFGSLLDSLELIDEFRSHGLKPKDSFYHAFISRLGDKSDASLQIMNQLLSKLAEHGDFLSNSIAVLVKEWFER